MSTQRGSGEKHEGAKPSDIAIIGMSCMFPGAPDIDAYWHNILSKVNAITDPPPEAWDSEVYYDPESGESDRIYCKRGGFLGPLTYFDPIAYGIPPNSVGGGEPDQWLALKLAYDALGDAGYPDGVDEPERTSVVIGKGTYLNYGNLTVSQHVFGVNHALQIIESLHPEYSADDMEEIRRELRDSLPPMTPETVPGVVPNIITGRIANRLDLMGAAYTVDAACASSLIALDNAVRDLQQGRYDLTLVGGSQISTTVAISSIFCRLNALSKNEQIRPFDKNADGTILGEGIGMVVLKRREDAERDGDRIYALIKGVGTSSDGRGMSVMAPRIEGQELALRRAYEASGIDPRTVGLIEGHGTGTLAGDAAEIQSLTRVFGALDDDEREWCALGSVKSMIGHTIPASGIAGLIKMALSLHHKVLPPTLNCDEPNPGFAENKAPFYINTQTRPWIHSDADVPRRAGVNAFGFGGINAHAILEEYPDSEAASPKSHLHQWDSEVFILESDSREGLIKRVNQIEQFVAASPGVNLKDLAYTLNTNLDNGPYRLAVVASSLEDLEKKLSRAAQRLSDPKTTQIKDRAGIFFFEEKVSQGGKLAFIFPGEGAQYPNMLYDLCIHFPEMRRSFDRQDSVFIGHPRGYMPSDVTFPRPTFSDGDRAAVGERLWQMDGALEGVLTSNNALFTLLTRLGIQADAVVGHSTGEYSAMCASNIIDTTDDAVFRRVSRGLNQVYERQIAKDNIPKATLIALGTDRAQALEIAEQVGGNVHVAMDNCPHQVVLVADKSAEPAILDEVRNRGLIYQILPFDRAYHSEMFEPFLPELRELFDEISISLPDIAIWSAATASPYPTDLDGIKKLAVDQWKMPVEFSKTIDAMYSDGFRVFVEVGPRGGLTSFIDDILRGRPYLAVQSNTERRSGITQLNHLIGVLAAQGVGMQLDYLYERRAPKEVSLDDPGSYAQTRSATTVKLGTSWGGMSLSDDLVTRLRAKSGNVVIPERSEEGGNGVIRQASPAVLSHAELERLQEKQIEDPATIQPLIPTAQVPVPEISQEVIEPQIFAESLTPIPTVPQISAGDPSKYMLEYMDTMQQFLDLEQQVMEAYLGTARIAPTDVGVTSVEPVEPAMPLNDSQAAQPPPEAVAEATAAPEHRQENEAIVVEQQATELPSTDVDTTSGVIGSSSEMTANAIQDGLLLLISGRTGYPVEMLDLDLDMEGDLGIDSIKRVEILGAFRAKYGVLNEQDMESLADRKTIRQVVDFIAESSVAAGTVELHEPAPAGDGHPAQPLLNGAGSNRQFPFIGTIKTLVPGEELVVTRRLDLSEDLYLDDHRLGKDATLTGAGVGPLPVMPLTMSMEMMAEIGSLLMPDSILIGMRNIRGNRWIALDDSTLTLEISARIKQDTDNQVEVKIFEAVEESANAMPTNPFCEASLIFGSSYPTPPSIGEFSLKDEKTSEWATLTRDRLYSEVMFHGPRWWGVESVDRTGKDGNLVSMRVLPTDSFFKSEIDPPMVLDPVILDAAGQVVGFWTCETLDSGVMVVPFHVDEFHIYRPNPPVGTRVFSQAKITLIGEDETTSNIDLIGEDGVPWMSLVGWKDRRIDVPTDYYKFVLSPRKVTLSEPWGLPTSKFPETTAFQSLKLKNAIKVQVSFWLRVWSRLILTDNEFQEFNQLRTPEFKRVEWINSRLVAKDAVRAWLKQQHGIEMCPADIEIAHDEHGKPIPQGVWIDEIGVPPALSVAHTDGLAIAIVGRSSGQYSVGIDIERIRSQPEGFEETAFLPEERALLDSLEGDNRDQWVMRFWCAKEAMVKAIGRGAIEGPHGISVARVDFHTGTVWVTLRGKLAAEFPEFAANGAVVYTAEEDGYAVASTLCEKELRS